MGIPFRGLWHDISKLLPSEFFPYANYFYGEKSSCIEQKFNYAWLLHQKRNKHHWQWWLLQEDEGNLIILPMSDGCRKEMLADWIGAGKALGKTDTRGWYLANRHKINIHEDTREWVENKLGV